MVRYDEFPLSEQTHTVWTDYIRQGVAGAKRAGGALEKALNFYRYSQGDSMLGSASRTGNFNVDRAIYSIENLGVLGGVKTYDKLDADQKRILRERGGLDGLKGFSWKEIDQARQRLVDSGVSDPKIADVLENARVFKYEPACSVSADGMRFAYHGADNLQQAQILSAAIPNRDNPMAPELGFWASPVTTQDTYTKVDALHDLAANGAPAQVLERLGASQMRAAFDFELKGGSRILMVDSVAQADRVWRTYGIESVALENGTQMPGLDYEAMRRDGVDAVAFKVSGSPELSSSRFNINHDSVVVLNQDRIRPIEFDHTSTSLSGPELKALDELSGRSALFCDTSRECVYDRLEPYQKAHVEAMLPGVNGCSWAQIRQARDELGETMRSEPRLGECIERVAQTRFVDNEMGRCQAYDARQIDSLSSIKPERWAAMGAAASDLADGRTTKYDALTDPERQMVRKLVPDGVGARSWSEIDRARVSLTQSQKGGVTLGDCVREADRAYDAGQKAQERGGEARAVEPDRATFKGQSFEEQLSMQMDSQSIHDMNWDNQYTGAELGMESVWDPADDALEPGM